MTKKTITGILVTVLLLFTSANTMAAGASASVQPQTLQFIVIGDWGKQGSKNQKRVAGAMDNLAAKSEIDFIISTGDNFYPEGVISSSDALWQENFEKIYYLPHLKNLPWYVVLGNHDYKGEYHSQIEYGKQHPNWILPGNYYQRIKKVDDSTSVQFIFMDTNLFINEYRARPDIYRHILNRDPGEQLAWLRERLKEQHQWRIVIGHHPVFSTGRHHGDTEELMSVLPGLFERYGVHAYFSGHDHHLEHNKPTGGTHYFISGGGADHRRVRSGPYAEFSSASLGFTHVIVDEQCMRVSFINAEGDELYRTVIPVMPALSCGI